MGEPDVKWYVFDDRTNPNMPFIERVTMAKDRVHYLKDERVIAIPQVMILNLTEMYEFEKYAVDEGFEGIMLRDPLGRYKYGRSTVKENLLLKVKRFISEEATIIALEERMENLNESVPDAFGRARKAISKDMLAPTGMVGAFVMESPKWPTSFRVSASTLRPMREQKRAWENPNDYLLQLGRFKYFPHGVVDVPRHGVFEAIRGKEDL